jgi:prepilin-type processing-associated H-X9-DG protein
MGHGANVFGISNMRMAQGTLLFLDGHCQLSAQNQPLML